MVILECLYNKIYFTFAEEGNLPPKAGIIVGVICGCVLLGGIVFALFYYSHQKRKRESTSSDNVSREQHESLQLHRAPAEPQHQVEPPSALPPSAPPPSNPDEYVPAYPQSPPTYDEAVSEQPKSAIV